MIYCQRKKWIAPCSELQYKSSLAVVPGGVATSTSVSTWMGDLLGNTAAAEPVDGVSVRHLIADGLRHAEGKRSSDVTARSALSQRTHVVGQTLKGIHTKCWP
jgi:hypothetical protein